MSEPTELTPVACPRCATLFLPQSQDTNATTVCPHCRRKIRIGDCSPVETSLSVNRVDYIESKILERTKRNAIHFRWITLLGSLVMVGIIVLLWKRWPRETADPNAAQRQAAEQATSQEIDQAFAAAKAALESSDWQGMMIHVLDPDRVRPLMEWYYLQREGGFTKRAVSGFDGPLMDLRNAPPTATLRIQTDRGVLHVLLQKTPEGWKLDWESFSGVYPARWAHFLKQTADVPDTMDIPVLVERLSENLLFPSFFKQSGFNKTDAGRAIKMYCQSVDDHAAACLPPDFADGITILESIPEPGDREKFVLKVKLLSKDSYPPAVEVLRVIRKGWNHPPAPQRSRNS